MIEYRKQTEEVRKELEPRYERLNELWAKVENELSSFKPPYDVWFNYSCDEWSGEPQSYLGFTKWRGVWRICHGHYVGGLDEIGSDGPIMECSGITRTSCVQHIGGLVKSIIEDSKRFAEIADKAIEQLESYVGAIERKR